MEEKHLPGQHQQKKHGKGVFPSSGDLDYILADPRIERAVVLLSNKKKVRVVGGDGFVEVPNDAIADVHSHRENSEIDGEGRPILSASDYLTALRQALKFGQYSLTAIHPRTKLSKTLMVENPSREFVSMFEQWHQNLGKMVDEARYPNSAFVIEGKRLGIFKHLPTRHDQKDHGRKRRFYALSEITKGDVDKWEDYVGQGASRSQERVASFARSALWAKDSFESITRVLRDDSGEAQSFFQIENRYGDEAAHQFEKYGYNQVADDIGPKEQIHVLQYLGTAPWHLESEGVSGWGAAALYESAKYVLNDGGKRMMLLSANPLSSEFYDKVGMRRVDDEIEGQTPFEFDVEGMQAYMREYEIRHPVLQTDYSGYSKSLAY